MNKVGQTTHYRRWLESSAVYADRRVLAILFLGFSSGLPLALTFGTLSIWLAEVGVTKTTIGLFALMGAPYTFKFLWAPLVDRMSLPYFTRRLGRRRGWAILTQLALMASIAGLGATNQGAHPICIKLTETRMSRNRKFSIIWVFLVPRCRKLHKAFWSKATVLPETP
ncbi:MAG: hypothetical protein KAV83_12455 [Desulfobacterales bacterium]|nr:hypothetical protein [Desulfobacterales bacterium]